MNNNITNIISIDVGIKNLACCILSVNNYEIVKWDVLNLCNKENIYRNCSVDKCKRLIFYKNITGDFYCKIHSKKSGFIIPCKEHTITSLKKVKLEELIIYCKDNKIDICHSDDDNDNENNKIKKHTKKTILGKINDFLINNCLEIVKKDDANKMTLIDVGKNIVHQLNSFIGELDINTVLIENQISPIANRMKTIQGMIAQYFIMNNIEDIQFINASNKLKLFTEPGEKTTYKERKNRSIDITRKIIEEIYEIDNTDNKTYNKNNNDIITLFNQHKKKDDLADCFLQAYWYITMLK